MLLNDKDEKDIIIERLNDEDLTDEERAAFEEGEAEYRRGECSEYDSVEDLMRELGDL